MTKEPWSGLALLKADDLPPRVVDDRKAARKRTLLAGKVIYGGDNETVRDCTIRDISEKGARIALAKGECVPTRLFLMDRRSATLFEARVTWIKAPDFGLSFAASYSLNSELPTELRYMKRIWADFRSPLSGAHY